MEENKTTVDSTPAAVTGTVVPSTTTETEDVEARLAKLEEEKDNYKKAFLKEKDKNKRVENFEGESEEDRIRRIAAETLADSRIAEIAREQDSLIKNALKENKELKLALSNKATSSPAAAVGTHSEGTPVRDTLITPEQMEYFTKTLKWGAKEIENYKRLQLKNR